MQVTHRRHETDWHSSSIPFHRQPLHRRHRSHDSHESNYKRLTQCRVRDCPPKRTLQGEFKNRCKSRSRRGNEAEVFFAPKSLSGHEHKYDDVRCAQFGLWRGARRAHPPKWGCNRRATTPQAKFGATLRAAVLFRPDFVARSSQIHFGICSSLAPRLAEESLAANVIVFMFMTT